MVKPHKSIRTHLLYGRFHGAALPFTRMAASGALQHHVMRSDAVEAVEAFGGCDLGPTSLQRCVPESVSQHMESHNPFMLQTTQIYLIDHYYSNPLSGTFCWKHAKKMRARTNVSDVDFSSLFPQSVDGTLAFTPKKLVVDVHPSIWFLEALF